MLRVRPHANDLRGIFGGGGFTKHRFFAAAAGKESRDSITTHGRIYRVSSLDSFCLGSGLRALGHGLSRLCHSVGGVAVVLRAIDIAYRLHRCRSPVLRFDSRVCPETRGWRRHHAGLPSHQTYLRSISVRRVFCRLGLHFSDGQPLRYRSRPLRSVHRRQHQRQVLPTARTRCQHPVHGGRRRSPVHRVPTEPRLSLGSSDL